MKYFRNSIFCAAAAMLCLLTASCEKFLDVNPKSEVVNDDMFDSAKGCEEAIAGLYGALKSINVYGEYYNWGVFDLLSQDLEVSTQIEPQCYIGRFDFKSAEDLIESMWSAPYKIIGYANNIIMNVERIEAGTYPHQDMYLGEAYGVRALMHLELVKAFASNVELYPSKEGIPYVTEYSFAHTPFSTVKEVYEKIAADFTKAQSLLASEADSEIAYNAASEVKEQYLKYRQLHMNYYAVTAYLARTYWLMGEYGKAKDEALKVINSGEFSFETKDKVINLMAGYVAETEAMFGIYSTSYFDRTYERLYQNASWLSFSLFSSDSGSNYPVMYEDVYTKDVAGDCGFDARQNWVRKLENGINVRLLKSVSSTRVQDITSDRPMEGISLIRLPEMYYIVAEYFVRNNQHAQAEPYFDAVISARGLLPLCDRTPAVELTLDVLYNDRHKEFFGEGMRWFDMKKLNMDVMNNYSATSWKAESGIYDLPIPVSEKDYRNE